MKLQRSTLTFLQYLKVVRFFLFEKTVFEAVAMTEVLVIAVSVLNFRDRYLIYFSSLLNAKLGIKLRKFRNRYFICLSKMRI